MKRRIVLDIDDDLANFLDGRRPHEAKYPIGRLLGAARAAVTGPQPDPCPTCQGVGCERCLATGRMHLAKVSIVSTSAGRSTLSLWQGAPGTMQPMAATRTDHDLADPTVDALLACLQDGGLIIDDRRTPMSDDNEIYLPSVDVCAWCSDSECNGIGCIAAIDPNDDIDQFERLHATIRAGLVLIRANEVLARAENRAGS